MPKRIFVTSFIAITLGLHLNAFACTDAKTTTVVFGNGIMVSEADASKTAKFVVQPAVEAAASLSVDRSCITYDYMYDSNFIDTSNRLVNYEIFGAQLNAAI